ncbi:hypothetical protein GCM10009647_090190 [Streptomyces sanglieri]|uniref:hypothetical protein n=1 Tax=Streptomyces sp. Wh19 TaxID=3076629 RepID=UPI002958BE64|nr:hypothetical protein [Streptomyces sp. Wh19]MDV9201635.1 hypothetical protein [Streptomyces sp. Wh19]
MSERLRDGDGAVSRLGTAVVPGLHYERQHRSGHEEHDHNHLQGEDLACEAPGMLARE